MNVNIKAENSRKERITGQIPLEKLEEMQKAAAIGVAVALAQSRSPHRTAGAAMNGRPSAWVIQARIAMTNRWPS